MVGKLQPEDGKAGWKVRREGSGFKNARRGRLKGWKSATGLEERTVYPRTLEGLRGIPNSATPVTVHAIFFIRMCGILSLIPLLNLVPA